MALTVTVFQETWCFRPLSSHLSCLLTPRWEICDWRQDWTRPAMKLSPIASWKYSSLWTCRSRVNHPQPHLHYAGRFLLVQVAQGLHWTSQPDHQLYEEFIPYGAVPSREPVYESFDEMAWQLPTFQSATRLSQYPVASCPCLLHHYTPWMSSSPHESVKLTHGLCPSLRLQSFSYRVAYSRDLYGLSVHLQSCVCDSLLWAFFLGVPSRVGG